MEIQADVYGITTFQNSSTPLMCWNCHHASRSRLMPEVFSLFLIAGPPHIVSQFFRYRRNLWCVGDIKGFRTAKKAVISANTSSPT